MNRNVLRCQKCGQENPLGGVFCRQCGVKLDLSQLTSEQVEKAQQPGWFAENRGKLIAIPVALLILAVGVALWPHTRPLGDPGTVVGARRAEKRLQSFRSLPDAQRLGVDPAFTEADINGYYRFLKLKSMAGKAFSVDITPRAVQMRLIRALFSVRIGEFRITPKISFDVTAVPVNGELVPQSARIGHLPAVGPLAAVPVGQIRAVLTGDRDLSGLAQVVEITLRDGAVGLVLEP